MAEELSIDRLWRCGVGHIVEIDSGVPSYDMGSCPICGALDELRQRAERAEAVLQKIANVAHFAWEDPKPIRQAFELIEGAIRQAFELIEGEARTALKSDA